MLLWLLERCLAIPIDTRARLVWEAAALAALAIALRLTLTEPARGSRAVKSAAAMVLVEELVVFGTLWTWGAIAVLWRNLPPLQGLAAAIAAFAVLGMMARSCLTHPVRPAADYPPYPPRPAADLH